MKITLSNGIILDDDNDMAKSLKEYAIEKGITDARVFITSNRTYLLVIDTQPKYESSVAEDVAVHIDILSLQAQDE